MSDQDDWEFAGPDDAKAQIRADCELLHLRRARVELPSAAGNGHWRSQNGCCFEFSFPRNRTQSRRRNGPSHHHRLRNRISPFVTLPNPALNLSDRKPRRREPAPSHLLVRVNAISGLCTTLGRPLVRVWPAGCRGGPITAIAPSPNADSRENLCASASSRRIGDVTAILCSDAELMHRLSTGAPQQTADEA
jgi:hypothetical protein